MEYRHLVSHLNLVNLVNLVSLHVQSHKVDLVNLVRCHYLVNLF